MPAFDSTGHPLHVGDHVAPLSYTGPACEAPVYRITRICTDSLTLQLSRADGSTLYREAAEVRYLSPAERETLDYLHACAAAAADLSDPWEIGYARPAKLHS